MKDIRYFYVPNAATVGELPEEEAKHAVKVLRLQSGDRMVLVDGEGGLFDAEVSVASGKHCLYNILETLPYESDCKFSERKTLRTDRVERIVVSAMKQSHKACKPVVNEMCSFKDFITKEREGRKFIAHCYAEVDRKDLFGELATIDAETPVTVLVGPEGDFSIDEVKLAMDITRQKPFAHRDGRSECGYDGQSV